MQACAAGAVQRLLGDAAAGTAGRAAATMHLTECLLAQVAAFTWVQVIGHVLGHIVHRPIINVPGQSDRARGG